jgi:trans-2,3-dihydro-3-hydroxyanthranilate isomerase
MPRSYRYLHLDVFTARPFAGNQLAVFLDGTGLEPDVMQSIANEMNFSESTFVLPAERADTDMRVRIFTPGEELPMAGHPTIGTAFALAHAGLVERSRQSVVFGLGVGPTPVELAWADNGLRFAWMTQPNPEFSPPLADPSLAAAALGVPAEAVPGSGLPVQVVSCGVPYLIVPLVSRAIVDAARLSADAYDRLGRDTGLGNIAIYLFTTERSAADSATVYSRMFAPSIGIGEDPATGSAAGPLGCYLVAHAVPGVANAATIVNLQGVRMGRPSVIHMAIAGDGRTITRVRVGGEAVLAGEGTLYV